MDVLPKAADDLPSGDNELQGIVPNKQTDSDSENVKVCVKSSSALFFLPGFLSALGSCQNQIQMSKTKSWTITAKFLDIPTKTLVCQNKILDYQN